ncbi:glycoside hydrolase family 13 protein [Patellaria atrata CBS 101060]|uniref:Glycoside hydrolase family 13 protein n=1 Tax=Patellaria atrata CBS 101060 TaxID=1346257 RepID=A0A9P4SJ73_9PEZI|nr:glycoside hydrolase family 13 protein [Patellaria atrata CBS 101060]
MGDEIRKPTHENYCMFQAYEWNVPSDRKHYQRLIKALPALKACGIDNFWLPPGCKAGEPDGAGYDIYDLYDLGEFEQKGTRATKWGSKEELLELSAKAKEHGVGLYWDAVLNHKAAADNKEKCTVVEVEGDDRTKVTSGPHEITAWVGFEFPGRGDKYSSMKWHWYHFSGTDFDAETEKKAIYKIQGDGKNWAQDVADEQGNADFMMFADVDFNQPEVVEDVKKWGVWITKEVGLKGFRLDAVQHFSQGFTQEWIETVRKECGDDIFMVGEYWVPERKPMQNWLKQMKHKFALYDAPLVYTFSEISKSEDADLRRVFDKSFVQIEPENTVTLVMNHDTQPGQTVETPIEPFFKPLAHALVLLRKDGYPCVFYGDIYGLKGIGKKVPSEPPSCDGKVPDMTLARKLYCYGDQEDYFDKANCIGWVRRGTWDKPFGMAVIMSNAEENEKRMAVGEMHKGEVWTDVLSWSKREVIIDDEGYGLFSCPATSMAVYVNRDADGRDKFPVQFDSNIYEDS